MPHWPADLWSVTALLLHAAAAIGAATLAIWLHPRAVRLGAAGQASVFALVLVEVLLLTLEIRLAQVPRLVGIMLRLLVTAGALVLVHNLYGGASRATRRAMRWPAAALATL